MVKEWKKSFYLNNKCFKSKTFKDNDKLKLLLKLARTNKYSAPQLSKKFNCTRDTVIRVLYTHGIVLNNKGRFPKKYYCNENFFKTFNPASAYWAGFIAADGCIHVNGNQKVLQVALNSDDESHIIKFKKILKTNARISFNSTTNSARLCLYSNKLCDSLIDIGITPRKSLTIQKVNVPKKLMSNFVRGVFDGDGSLSGNKVTHIQVMIAGNKPFLGWIQKNLVENCGLNNVKLYKLFLSKAYKIQYTGVQSLKILEYLYKDSSSSIRLERKYKKFLQFKHKFLK